MAKGKEEKVEGITEPEPITQVEPEAEKTYSKAEYEADMARIQEEAEASKNSALKEQFNKLNERLSRKGAELQQLRHKTPQPQSQTLKALLKAAESGDYGDAQAMLSQLEQAEVEEARTQQWQELSDQKRDEFKQSIIAAGQDPEDDEFVDIMLDVENAIYGHGKFPLIEKKLNRKLEGMSPKKEAEKVKKVTLADLSDEDKEELKRQAMEGELGTHISSPSGGGSDAEWKKQWASGELPATKENLDKARRLTGV